MSSGGADDNILVGRVLAGDRAAFRLLVRRHEKRVFYLGVKFLHNLQDAEDFAQEVFLKAFRKLESFQGKVPFGAWLYRLAFNLAVNQYHVSRRRLTEVDPEELVLPDPGGSPEDAVVRQEQRRRIDAVVGELPEVYQLMIKMHFFEAMSYPQISEVTGIPVNTIKSHVFRAKRLIRRSLEKAGVVHKTDTRGTEVSS